MNNTSRVLSVFSLGVSLATTEAAQAQDVYNFYFQKAPASAVTAPISTMAPQPSATAPSTPSTPPVNAPLAPAPAAVVSTALPSAAEDKPKFYNWNVQLLRANVTDSYSDATRWVSERLGLQVGYRFNKFVGAELGASFGSMYGSWKAATGADLSESFVPFLGARLNPFHLNVFGSEVVEIFFVGGAMYLDSSAGQLGDGLTPSRGGNQQIYGYLGGGARICFGERVGLEIAGHAQNGDPRFGFSTLGVDVRF